MRQKTVHLPFGVYRISGDTLEELNVYSKEWEPTPYRIGAECVLVGVTNVSPSALRDGTSRETFSLRFDCLGDTPAETGVPGNSNPRIRSLHGWRGTTNDKRLCAYGKRKITAIRRIKQDKLGGTIAVTVGRDLSPLDS